MIVPKRIVFSFLSLSSFIVLLILVMSVDGFATKIGETNVACFTPFGISQTGQSSHSAEIQWKDFNSSIDIIRYEYTYNLAGESPNYEQLDTSYQKSTLIDNLLPGQSYEFYVRGICASGTSNFTNRFIFDTHILNESPCNTSLLISDNNCSTPDTFYIEVEGQNEQLGLDVFIRNFNVTIQHNWPADLEVSLMSPNGKIISLFNDIGLANGNVGDIQVPCENYLSFDMNACEQIAAGTNLIGTYRPTGDMNIFYDQSSPNGVWKLVICDDAIGQTGNLLFAELNFANENCSGPESLYFRDINATEISLIIPSSNCDSLEIIYGNGLSEDIVFYVPCTRDTVKINDLEIGTDYTLMFAPMCSGTAFSLSCPKNFTTRCDSSSLSTSFDELENCNGSCEVECLTGNLWTNVANANWKVSEGETGTIFTGPTDDFYGKGKYLYIESSDTLCKNQDVVLLSSCLFVEDSSACNFSFAYHMYGNDISFLQVEVSDDNMQSWDTIWVKHGNQGNIWNSMHLNLAVFFQKFIHIRIKSIIPAGNFSDIAIDQLVFSKVRSQSDLESFIYIDNDQDGYGKDSTGIRFCGATAPDGFSFIAGDCDDMNSDINPGILESPCNSIDDNCNNIIDESNSTSLDYEIVQIQDQTCIGIENGIIQVQAIGGTEPYTYQWEDGVQGSLRSNLKSGIYLGKVTDATGCSVNFDTIKIDIIQKFDYFINSIDDATCLGINDGSIDIFHDDANAPFNYLWSNGDTTQNIENLAVDTYTLTITDVNGCQIVTNDIIVNAFSPIGISLDSLEDVKCNGASDGLLDVSPLNHTGNVTYHWSNNQETSFISQLNSGLYSVTVMDEIGCYTVAEYQIKEPKPLIVSLIANDPVTCYGEQTGSLEITVSGGTSPFSAMWSNGNTQLINSPLFTGLYGVTVSDENGCSQEINNIFVSESEKLKIDSLHIKPEICNNQHASIEAFVNGGTSGYQFFWSDDISRNNKLAENLSAGLYSLTVIDAFECKVSQENIGVSKVDIPLNITEINTVDVSCFGGENGSIQINVPNASQLPIQFYLDNTPYSSESQDFNFTNLQAGTYRIQAIDSNLCKSDSVLFEINQPDKLIASIDSLSNNLCESDTTGFIRIKANGGTLTYNYSWSSNDSTPEISNLSTGNYSVTIEDAQGCLDSLSNIVIGSTPSFEIDSIIYNNPQCSNSLDGSIHIETSTPLDAIFIDWIGLENSDTSLTSLKPGTYFLEIRDTALCSVYLDTIELVAPPAINLELEDIIPSYCGNNNGMILTHSDQDLMSFMWFKSTSDGDSLLENQTQQNANLLGKGVYSLIVSDFNACMDTLTALSIEEFNKEIKLEVELISEASCANSKNGFIQFNIEGFELKPPFEIYLNNNITSTSNDFEVLLTNLTPDTYNLKVIDADGCEVTVKDLTIESPPPINFQLNILEEIACYGDTNAIITIKAQGGTGELEYLWNNEDKGDTIINLGPGLYACAIVDENNCVKFTDTIVLNEPDSLFMNSVVIDATNDENNGAIYIETFGGTPPYIYNWTPDLPNYVDTLEALGESNWQLEIVDSRGCSIDTSFIVQRLVSVQDIEKLNLIHIYPNPSNGLISIQTEGRSISSIQIWDLSGNSIQYKQLQEQASILQLDLQNAPSGIYFMQLNCTDGNIYHSKIMVE